MSVVKAERGMYQKSGVNIIVHHGIRLASRSKAFTGAP
jgi:hypothetical protein